MRRSPRRPALLACLGIGLIVSCSDDQPTAPARTVESAPVLHKLSSAFDAYEFLEPFVTDDNGPNDTPAQSDLNSFTRADNVAGFLGVAWTWDDIDSWTGSGQTGDACALFDTDGDGNANYAVCARITNAPDGSVVQLGGGQSPQIYQCSDKKADRCSQPNPPPLPLQGTFCEVSLTDETFPGAGDDGADVLAACAIQLSAIGSAANTNLLNVCSFPSGAPNSNPFDCVLREGKGFIRIIKKTPEQSDETFSFTIAKTGGATTNHDILDDSGDDDATGLIALDAGTYAVSESTPPTGWALYGQPVCKRDGTEVGTPSGSTVSNLSLTVGETIECTFENRIVTPEIEVTKTATPDEIWETGEKVRYDVTVENKSSTAVTLDELTDDAFGDLDGKGTCATGGSIAAGATYECWFEEDLPAAAADDTHENTVTAKASNAGGTAEDSDNAIVTYKDVAPEIEVTKTASKDEVPETGESVTFEVKVKNTSTVEVKLTYLNDDVFGDLDGKGTCSLGTEQNPTMIAAGATYTCEFSETLESEADPDTPHNNTVTARAVDDDANEAEDSDDATVTFTDVLPEIEVIKSVDPTSLSFGGGGTLVHNFDLSKTRTFTTSYVPEGNGYQFNDDTCDDGGPNDVPAQVDLNCFNRADNVDDVLAVQWTWDATNLWTGSGQTGDACALLDTDDDGYANVAVCARISNTPDGSQIVQVGGPGAVDVYQCNDRQPDRCAKQVVKFANVGSTVCHVSKITPAAGVLNGDGGQDVEALCEIDLTMAAFGGDSPDLLNVCSFPSGEPNSNPFDCVVQAGAGFVQIVKSASPSTTSQFGFTMSDEATDGSIHYLVTGSLTTALIPVMPKNGMSLTEIMPEGWDLTGAECKIDGNPTGGFSAASDQVTFDVKRGQTTVCTFNNTGEISGDVTYTIQVINKTLEPLYLFSLSDNMFGNLNGVGQGATACATGVAVVIPVGNTGYSCSFVKTLTGSPGGSHTNKVKAEAKDNEGNTTGEVESNTATVTFTGGT